MYTLPKLNYDYDALGSSISVDIMKLHHSKHHQTYVDKLNQAVFGLECDKGDLSELKSVLQNLDSLGEGTIDAVRNHGGGHYNHTLFWEYMNPKGGGEPSGDLYKKIVQKYGSYQNFVDEFSVQSLSVFGSGWCWLLDDMSIVKTQNQDNPLMFGYSEPVLGLDVWEHAYYLDYKNDRADYIKHWWNVVNWEKISDDYSRRA